MEEAAHEASVACSPAFVVGRRAPIPQTANVKAHVTAAHGSNLMVQNHDSGIRVQDVG